MPLIKTKSGWQVISADGQEKLSLDNLTREQAEKREKELRERRPLLTWARDKGILK